MLTNRGRWILSLAAVALLASVFLRHEGVAIASLALLVWLVMEWFEFRRRVSTATDVFSAVQRSIDGNATAAQVATIDQPHAVALAVSPVAILTGLRLTIEDVAPPGCDVPQGTASIVSDAAPRQLLRWQYQLRPHRTGQLQLPGLQVKLNDPQGLFVQHRFVPLRQDLTVLPFLIRPQSTVSVLKPQNCQLLAGQHRYRQPGIGGELLSIRDYQAGDPPRSIAWKASARTGRLMTCEYESEVPIRGLLIADLSPHHFVGRPGPAMADQIVAVAASVARLLLADRDPVGCLIVNQSHRSRVSHGHGERQLTRLLHVLLAHVSTQSIPPGGALESLLGVAWTACLQRFPELFDERINPQTGLFRVTRKRRDQLQRRQLALALATLYRLGPGWPERLIQDDVALARGCRRYLVDYPAAVAPAPPIPDPAELLVIRRQATETICRGLLEAVARARDNELFVIIGELPVEAADLNRLEECLRIARAAYHRVILLAAQEDAVESAVADPTVRRILWAARAEQQHTQTEQAKRRLERLGVVITNLQRSSVHEEVAAEVELLRYGRVRRAASGDRR